MAGGSKQKWPVSQVRLFKMVSVGVIDDPINRGYDIISTGALLANLTASIMLTFDSVNVRFGTPLHWIEIVTVIFFAIDYVLRIMTADCLYPEDNPHKSIFKYVTSLAGIIDLMSFLPYALPFVFPIGTAAFRMFRVARIFRLFRINAYYDSLNVITDVIASKKQQLLSSVFIIVVLMVASSLCMYSLEHEAQPEVFENAFSGIWWAAAALLTVGYGDIYPITFLGKLFGIFITFLGVGMVAIPTGIISAGFVEQYSRYKRFGDYEIEGSLHFIDVDITKNDSWVGKQIRELGLPKHILVAVIKRHSENLVPKGDTIIQPGDTVVLGTETAGRQRPMELKSLTLGQNHNWVGQKLSDLDIPRKTLIVMVKRSGTMLTPASDLKLRRGDTLYLYRKIPETNATVNGIPTDTTAL